MSNHAAKATHRDGGDRRDDTGILGERECQANIAMYFAERYCTTDLSNLRCVTQTVVVRDSLDAAGTRHGYVTALVAEVDSDHGHRSHSCLVLWVESTLPSM